MRSKPRGLVLIITNIDYKYPHKEPRNSAMYDELNLKQLFEQMGFYVYSYCNLTGQVTILLYFTYKKQIQILHRIMANFLSLRNY